MRPSRPSRYTPSPNFKVELLEDRVVPSGTPGIAFDPNETFAANEPPPESVAVEWQGQTRLAAPGRWMVQVEGLTGSPAEQVAALDAVAASLGLDVRVERHLGLDGQFLLAGPSALDAQTVAAALGTVAAVRYVEPDFVEASGQVIPNDANFAQLWGMNNTGTNPGVGAGVPDADIDAPEAWDLTGPTRGSTRIVTAVVDSGVDYTHPDLYLNIWLNQTEIPDAIRPNLLDTDGDGLITFYDLNAAANAGRVADNNLNGRIDAGDVLRPVAVGGWMDGIDGNATAGPNGFADDLVGWDFFANDNNPDDEVVNVWHGTHVTGTIAGIGNNGIGVAGVTWRNQIMIVRGLGPNNTGPYSALVGALNYAVANDATLSNHSWGGTAPSAALEQAVINARDNGHLMVVAAGNNGWNNDTIGTPSIPASYPYDNIISVANLTNTNLRNGSSNWGLVSVDLGAPGTNVFSTFHSTRGGSYGYLTGTSMATPHVAGTAALMWSLNPGATYTQIRDAILGTVDPVDALRTNGPTPVATGGRLNAASAVAAVGFAVTTTTPAAGAVVSAPVTEFVVNFSQPYDPASVQASDLTVNGIAATGVVFTDADTLTFTFDTSPVTAEGVQTLAVAAGAINGQNNGAGVSVFTGTFRFDATPLAVTAISPQPGTIVAAPFTFVDVTFNESVNPASVQAADLTASRGSVVGAEVLPNTDGRTVRFALSGLTTSGPVTLTLGAGRVSDGFGNPGPATPFAVTFGVNTLATVFPVPLTAVPPLGSLAYTGSTVGVIGAPGELDPFALSVDAGQTITVVVTPPAGPVAFGEDGAVGAASTLRPTIELRNPAGQVVATALAPTAGMPAVLQVGAAATTGTYTITVGATEGADAYTLRVYLNAAVEAEALGGPTNGTRGTAQNLAFLDLLAGSPAQVAAVRGQLVAAATGQNLIANGGFETGTFGNWTVTPVIGLNGWQINNGTLDPASPATPLAPISGSFDAVSNTTGPGVRVITQSFVVPANVPQATLTWSDRIQNFANQFQDPNQEFRVLLLDAQGLLVQTVFSTNLGDPLSQVGPNSRSFDVTAALQGRAGQTLQLRFEQQDSLNFFNVTLDNVSLVVADPNAAPADDFYALNLEAGQSVDVALAVPNVTSAPAFAPTRTDFAAPANRYAIFVAYRDLNGDGNQDMVAIHNDLGANQNGAIGVRMGNGDGTFGPLTEYLTGGVFTRYLDFGDVNGDGKLDVVATNDASLFVSLFLGNGDGTFQTVRNFSSRVSGLGLTVADVNADGRADAVVPYFAGLVGIYLGQADGTLVLANTLSANSGGTFGTDVGDLNGDGRADIVTANFSGGTMSVFLQQANGTFGPATVLTMGAGAWDVELADLNGDGRLDAITGNQNANNVAVRLGNGNGTFGNATFFGTGGNGPRTITVSDVNNDGRLDVVVPNISSATIGVLPGNGNGTFGTAQVYATNTNPNAATAADVNNDGLIDISSADAAGRAVTVRLNTTPQVRVELQDAAGNVVATGTTGATNFARGLTFTAPAAGTYYARVFGTVPTATYTLVATRDAAFDREGNGTPATAQNLNGTSGALGAIGGAVTTGTLNFSELPANTPANGVTVNGVTFGFTIGGQPSTQAVYNGNGPGVTRYTTPPQLVGPITASAPAVLSLTFATPTTALSFGLAANATTTLTNAATVRLFNEANALIGTFPLTLAPQVGFSNFAEVLFTYTGAAAKRAELTFSGVGASAFAFDNLTYQTGGADEDFYALSLAAGERVRLTTTTPAGGPGEFVNPLNPRIELLDAAGTVVATGTALLDGRNETLAFTAPAAGTYRVRVFGEGNTTGEYFLNVNRAPVAVADAATTNEDAPVEIAVLANDTDDTPLAGATVAIVGGPANGTVSVSAQGVVTYAPNANFSGTDSFTYSFTDAGGEVSNVATVSLTVTAVADAPALTVTPTASGNETAAIPLDISAALVDTDGSEVLSITISGVPASATLSAGTNNGDGTWTLTPAQLTGLTIALPDNLPNDAAFTLTVTATATEQSNGSVASASAPVAVTVRNVAPVAAVSGPAVGVRGQARVFALSASDLSPVDQAAGFTYAINWGDGTTQTVTGPTGTNVEHVYERSGTFTVTVTATDKDGGVSAVATRTVTVSAVGVQEGTLVVGGTNGNDVILVTPGPDNSYVVSITSALPGGGVEVTLAVVTPRPDGYQIELTIGNVYLGVFVVPFAPPLSLVEVYAQGGDDIVHVVGGVNLDAALFGGNGDDFLKGGGRNNLLDGGAGDDELTGSNGRDVMIGGAGSDRLIGQNGNDLLFGGLFLPEETSQTARVSALKGLAATWYSAPSLAEAITELTPYLMPRIKDDGAADRLTGGGGEDWYLALLTGPEGVSDVVTGVTARDVVTGL